jgi:hypothetical protein
MFQIDTRFWNRRDHHLFAAVIREVFDKSHTYCNLYIPKLDAPGSSYDALFGEARPGQIIYYKVSNVRVMAQIVQNTYDVSERGSVLLNDQVEYTFYLPEIEPFFDSLGLAEGFRISMVGVIIEFDDILYEVTQDTEDVYIFNDREPEFLKVTLEARTSIVTRKKIEGANVIVLR